ncbi:hypothetical protein B0I37DRAFT_422453 [Chaetomium sp. MPI-CAGE-AT-0009]|nr:hypothetical protein B0I37DRAFT_422453 [Chaetomium sp. MPI-CAGE-AT-0009]
MSHSAPYGHACMSCFKAKCRCIPLRHGDGCERCRRLKKHCTPSNSTRRRVNIHQRPNSEGRVTPFEDLVPLFQSCDAYEADRAAEQQHRVHCGLPSLGSLTSLEALLDPFLEIPTNAPNKGTHGTPDSATAPCLETFHSHMLPHFPFIHLPAETTPQQLQHQRPFLSRAISCVASPTSCEKRVRAAELKHLLCSMAFLQQQERNDTERSQAGHTLDLLLGLLVYVAWGWDHLVSGRLMSLAMSLVGEVLPSKFTASDMHTLGLVTPDIGYTGGPMLPEQLLERQRAVLACFVLSSAVSTYSGQVDALRWTPQMKHSLSALSANTEHPTDAVLALQVHLQLLTSQALQLRSRNRHTKYQAAAEALLAQLQGVRPAVMQHQVTPALTTSSQTGSLPAHFHHAELTILETLHASTTTPPPTIYPHPHNNNTTNTRTNPKSTHPYNILLALQSSASTLLTLPDPSFRGIALLQWAQLAACLSALHRLEGDTRWDAASVRLVADLPGGGDGGGDGEGLLGLVGGEGGVDVEGPQKGYVGGQGLWLDGFWSEVD